MIKLRLIHSNPLAALIFKIAAILTLLTFVVVLFDCLSHGTSPSLQMIGVFSLLLSLSGLIFSVERNITVTRKSVMVTDYLWGKCIHAHSCTYGGAAQIHVSAFGRRWLAFEQSGPDPFFITHVLSSQPEHLYLKYALENSSTAGMTSLC